MYNAGWPVLPPAGRPRQLPMPNLPTNMIPTVLRLLDSNFPGSSLYGPGNSTP